MDTEEMQKLKRENYPEYRRNYGTVTSVRMEKNYSLRGKWSHLKTKKHERNYFAMKPLIKL